MSAEEVLDLTRPQFEDRVRDIGEIQKQMNGNGKGRIHRVKRPKGAAFPKAIEVG